jgi:hypothetical protein
VFDRSLGRGQVDEHETALWPENAPHLPKSRPDFEWGKDIDEVAGEDGVERIVGMGERRYVSVEEAVSGMGAVAHAPAGSVQHRSGEVHTLRPAGGGSGGQWAQREARAGPRVQNALAVPHC